jgi:hypothetical protein
MNDLAKLRKLARTDLADLVLAMALLPVLAVAVRLGRLRILRRIIAATASHERASTADAPQSAVRIARLVSAVARRCPIHANCMARALTLHWLLLRRGIASSLRIGVCKVEDRLEAHIWVEHGDHALMEKPGVHDRFAPFDALPAADLRP